MSPPAASTHPALGEVVATAGLVALARPGRGALSAAAIAAHIALTAAFIVVMPWLARAKRRVGEQLGSRLVIADAAETRLCALLSVSTFLGLLGFAA